MITGVRGTKRGEDSGAEAWCERVGMRVAGGGGHLDTHQSGRRCSPMCREDAFVGLGGVASGVGNAEKCRVHVPPAAGAPRWEQRVFSDVLSRSFGFPAQGARGYAPLVAVQRGPAGLPGRGSTCQA
jgi:hypothetical protein